MNDKRSKNLDLISKIDDDIIDRNTQKRINLLQKAARKPQRNRYIAVLSFAAMLSILAVLFAVILIPSLGKQVPVYRGMTVSDTNTVLTASNVSSVYQPLSTDGTSSADLLAERLSLEDIIKTEAKKPSGLLRYDGNTKQLHYAEPNEYVYITIHIDNPDNYEILSFTLNGEKYSSYMFEAGSDMENIVLKRKIGNIEGLCEYTIDAIKYVDGTKIKDVSMEGDRTVCVGVHAYTCPSARVFDAVAGIDSASFKVSAEDKLGLVEFCGGKLYSVLCDGAKVISAHEIHCGECEVRFDGLVPQKNYRYAVVGIYDAFDGSGICPYILCSGDIATQSVVGFDSYNVDLNKIEYTLKWNEGITERRIIAVSLYSNGQKLRDLDVNSTTVPELTSDTEYKLVVEYLYNGNTETLELEFRTKVNTSVPYKVNHYLQNVENDDYVLDKTENLIGTEKTSVTPDVLIYAGFTSPVSLTVTVNPNGSTQIDYYYTRNTYSVTFVAGYDNVVEQQYRFDADISDQIALREGYTFGGWYTDALLSQSFTSGKVPAENIKLYAWWTEETKACEFELKLTQNAYTLSKYVGSDAKVVIPESVGEYPVTAIGPRAFAESATLTEVIVSSKVTRIDSYAFSDCFVLNTVTLSPALVTIGTHAFSDCVALSQIELTEGIAKIGSGAFSGCETLALVYLPSTLTDIDDRAFYGCELLSGIALPDNLKKLGESAFAGCESLTEITIPSGIAQIEYGVFADCKALSKAVLIEGVTSIGSHAFVNCKKLTTLELPLSVTAIGEHAFDGCIKLSDGFTLKNIKSIGKYAFSNCVKLSGTVDLSGVESIGEYAFDGCYGINSVVFKDGLTAISDGAFRGCAGLSELKLPITLTSIGQEAFASCSSLTRLVLPNSLTVIGNSAFKECLALLNVHISDSVKTIEEKAFYQCNVLEKVTTGSGIVSVGAYAFDGCYALLAIEFKNGLATIGEHAFAETLEKITLPDTVMNIGNYAFSGGIAEITYNGSSADWQAIVKDSPWGSVKFVSCFDGKLYT